LSKRPIITPVADTPQNASAINVNLDRIEVAFDNTISRDGSTPNQMEADIDLNSNDLLNVNDLNATNLIIAGTNLNSEVLAAATSATNAASSEASAEQDANRAEAATAGVDSVYATVALLLASTEASRGVGVIWEAGGFRYIEVASGGDVTNSAGTPVQLDILENDDGTFNVKAFGAVGNGVTDDTAAIQTALDTLAGGNSRTARFPAGDFLISSTLIFRPQVRLVGDNTGIGLGEFRGTTFVAADGLTDYMLENGALTTSPADPWAHGVTIESIAFKNNTANTANGINFGPAGDNSKLYRLKFNRFPIGIWVHPTASVGTNALVAFSADTITFYDCEIGLLFDEASGSAAINNLMLDGNTIAGVKFNECGFNFHCNFTQVHVENVQSSKIFWAYDCSNSLVEFLSVNVEFAGSVATTTFFHLDQPTAANKTHVVIRDIVCTNGNATKTILEDTLDTITIPTSTDWNSYHHNTDIKTSGTAKLFGGYPDNRGDWSGTLEIADEAVGGNTATYTLQGAHYKEFPDHVDYWLDVRGVNLAGMTGGGTFYVRGLPVANGVWFSGFGVAHYSTPAGSAIIKSFVPEGGQTYIRFKLASNGTAIVSDLTTGGDLQLYISLVTEL